MKSLLLIFLALTLTGCMIAPRDYAEIALGHTIAGDDYPSDAFRLQLGVESKRGTRVFLEHNSHISAGTPLNNKDEITSDRIGISFKFGGH